MPLNYLPWIVGALYTLTIAYRMFKSKGNCVFKHKWQLTNTNGSNRCGTAYYKCSRCPCEKEKAYDNYGWL